MMDLNRLGYFHHFRKTTRHRYNRTIAKAGKEQSKYDDNTRENETGNRKQT